MIVFKSSQVWRWYSSSVCERISLSRAVRLNAGTSGTSNLSGMMMYLGQDVFPLALGDGGGGIGVVRESRGSFRHRRVFEYEVCFLCTRRSVGVLLS